MDYNELIRTGLTIQEDIENMNIYERVCYASDLFNRIHELPIDMFHKESVLALQRTLRARHVSILELKDVTAKELAETSLTNWQK